MKIGAKKEPTMLTPGTVQVSKRVWRAASLRQVHRRSDMAHEAMKEISAGLKKITGVSSKYCFLYFNSTGRGAIEAAVSSLAATRKTIFIPIQGRWSKNLAETATAYDANIKKVVFDQKSPLSLARLEKELIKHKPQIIFFVAHETEQGILNDVAGITKLCKRLGVVVAVDVMSAIVAEEIDFGRLGIDMFIFSSAKALRGVEGAGIVGINKDLASKLPHSKNRYFDIKREYKEQSANTLPTAPLASFTVFALREAIRELLEEGVATRRKDMKLKMGILKDWVRAAELQPTVPIHHIGNFSLIVQLPRGLTYKRLNAELEKKGFRVAYGAGGENGKEFEVSVAGHASLRDIKRFTRVANKILARKK